MLFLVGETEKAHFCCLQALSGNCILLSKRQIDLTEGFKIRTIHKTKRENREKNLLRKHRYPPDKQDEAVDLVLSQAEVISRELIS